MKSPIILSTLVITFLLASSANALPIQANINAQLAVGIKVDADFDWSTTNSLNNESYFSRHGAFTNFFDSRGLVFDPNNSDHGFLNAKKMVINNNKNGKDLKAFSTQDIVDAGERNYNTFGNAKHYNLSANDTVTGMGAGSGNGDEKFEIFGGATGSAMNVSIQFRSKTQSETYGGHNRKKHHTNNSTVGHSPLVGNVMRLHGMGIQDAVADGRVKTNPFALVGTYTQADFDATYSLTEYEELINKCLFLGWLNPAVDGDHTSVSDGDRWVHAVQGNFDNMPDNPNRSDQYNSIGDPLFMTLEDYIAGTATSIPGLLKEEGEIRVGDHGGYDVNNTVWAIIDHNSDFAVVPEPSTYALYGGIISLVFVALRRRK